MYFIYTKTSGFSSVHLKKFFRNIFYNEHNEPCFKEMLMKIRTSFQFSLPVLLAVLLTACSQQAPKLIAPEIAPPADLIPAYVPDGFELIKGYQLQVGEFKVREIPADAGNDGEGLRVACNLDRSGMFFDLQSPVGNDIQGIHYQSEDKLLLITRSSYPDGSLDLWLSAYEPTENSSSDCNCDCITSVVGFPAPLRRAEIKEVQTVGDTQVAVLERWGGWITIFVRDEYLLTVESSIPLEENLRIVESLLE